MKIALRTELPQWALIAGMFLASAAAWPMASERIPVHWGIDGQVDRYGGKWEGLLMTPAIALGVYLLMVFLPRIDPGRANYPRFKTAYLVFRVGFLVFAAVLHGAILLTALGYQVDVGRVVFLSMGVLFLVLGNFMGKIRPNWFVGVRTPWTLSSKRSWTRTHRAAGWFFILLGLVAIAGGIVPRPGVIAMIATALVGLPFLIIYSYLIWRSDPDRVAPAGPTPADDESSNDKSSA
jgi:uncharacterized membrane protein